ncbi:MAG TPA: hypothetical protein PLF40_12190 [Kofleriaceae bacterium]|nr:hypothetical protein [Kofleriaceae bacterium]
MKHVLRSLVDEYCAAYELPRVGAFTVQRRGAELRLRRGDVSVLGRLSAPLTLIGTFVARCNRTQLAARPLIVTAGVSFAIRARRLLYQAAEKFADAGETEEADLLLYLAFGEALLHEDEADGDAVELRPALVTRALKKPALVASLRGAHMPALKKLTVVAKKPAPLDQVRGLYAMASVLEDAAYSNELQLDAIVGATLHRTAQSKIAAVREAALLAIAALASQLFLGGAYREVLPYASALIDAGFDTPSNLAMRFAARAALVDDAAAADMAELMRYARNKRRVGWFKAPGAMDAYLLSMHLRAAKALLLNARGRDACLRRRKADLRKPTRDQRDQLVAAARAQLHAADALVAAGASAPPELGVLQAELKKLA